MRTRALLACALAVAAVSAAPAHAHEGNPDYSSEIEGFEPAVDGLTAEILNFDDSVRLINQSGETVVVEGYEGEPYLRLNADGSVDVNERSPAYYLNEDRYAEADVPASADPDAEPEWRQVDGNGQYTWHDHRSHYMGEGLPPQVTDESVRTKVFDYEIPLDVGGKPAALTGTLFWTGEEGRFPIVPFIALAVVALGLVALVVVMRRRRGDRHGDGGESKEATEAW